ncbi:MAG: DUF4268 domain-containing protein [Nitrospirae bacterium]|nr:DUF4268 domain-containing protein [Magnetococcales bacterium]HAT49717.1 DUF4268 domain-containing protein [Alphaproteobacteria bacterium]
MSMSLGCLEKVNVRQIWGSEANDFTPWLARRENLDILGETIGIKLEHAAIEKNVGPFRADILCKDTTTGCWVLVENQLERTDHIHLGQLLTYAAGLEAVTIVWIAALFTDEHRATLDWLNKITDEQYRFFGLELELWRIGDSSPAPKFNMVSKPKGWNRSSTRVATTLSAEDLTEIQKLQLDYWVQFHSFLKESQSFIKPKTPKGQHWMYFGIGCTGVSLCATIYNSGKRKQIGVDLYIDDSKAIFHLLHKDKIAIESEIGSPLKWSVLPGKKASRILLFRDDCDLSHADSWADYHGWMKEKLEKFWEVFRPRVKQLNVDDWSPPDSF